MNATAFSHWEGSWKQGAGSISTASHVLDHQPYTYASRFDGAPGANPEELLAAAHAGCFNQALANNFGMLSLEAASIDTTVEVRVALNELGRPAIAGIHITVDARAPGATPEQFAHCAERARTNCSIARILTIPITLTATLAV